MKRSIALGLTLLAGVAIGATAVNGLHAQSKVPGGYAIVDISAINNFDVFKTLFPIAGKAIDEFGGKYIIRTDKITGLDGTTPKRFVVVAFDSVEKAKAWHNSAAMKQVDDIRKKSTDSRQFIVEGVTE